MGAQASRLRKPANEQNAVIVVKRNDEHEVQKHATWDGTRNFPQARRLRSHVRIEVTGDPVKGRL